MNLKFLGQICLVPSLRLARQLLKKRLRRRKIGQSALQRVLSQLSLRVGCSLFYTAGFWSYQWLILRLFEGDAEKFPGVSGNEDVSTGVETDGQFRRRHIVVTRSLLPLAGGPSLMSLRLSIVEIRAGSCWSGSSMMVKFVFQFTSIVPFWLQIFITIALFRSVRHRSCCHCNSCHWSWDGVFVSLRLWGGEIATAVSLNE